jgi:hypothetical protein
MYIKGITNPPANPSGYSSINKYVNATNATAGWLYLNVSYAHTDLGFAIENTLNISKYNDSWYTSPLTFSSSRGANTAVNYVYANITNFISTYGSIFAPLATGEYPNITFITPTTPVNNSRSILNYANITVNVTSATLNIDTCILEWQENAVPPPISLVNYTMTKIGSGTSVLCQYNITTTTDGWRYWYKVYANNSGGGMNTSEYRTFLENTKPTTPTLYWPVVDNHTTNRTTFFNWTVSTDADGDSVNYTWNLSCFNNAGGSCSPTDSRIIQNITPINYTPTYNLKNFWDTLEYYNWTVMAWDGYENSTPATNRRLYIDSLVSITMITSSVNFTTMNPGTQDNTTDNDPNPLSMNNSGNCFINVSINGSSMWLTAPNPTIRYQFKADYLNIGSFNWTESATSWTNIPLTPPVLELSKFNYTYGNNSAETDINVSPTSYEPYGVRNSTVIFTGLFTDVPE